MARNPTIGGFSTGRIQLSLFIRDYLNGVSESWAEDIHGAYAAAVVAIPKRRGKARRKYISYLGFFSYMYMLQKLGLVEYVPGPDTAVIPGQSIKTGPSSVPHLTKYKRHYVRIVADRVNDPAWSNPRRALYG